MTPQNLINALLGDEPRIISAITSGAGWEIWMQVEFVLLCRERDWQVAREVPYPQGNQRLDFLLSAAFGESSAVELKVESATNAGQQVLQGFQNDVAKLQNYQTEFLVDRYALGLAYSGEAKHAFRNYAGQGNHRTYEVGQAVGVLVQSVPLG